jgi:hypothetical protein
VNEIDPDSTGVPSNETVPLTSPVFESDPQPTRAVSAATRNPVAAVWTVRMSPSFDQ